MSASALQDGTGTRRRETIRWAASLAAVVLVHAGIGWTLLNQLPMPQVEPDPPAIIVDLAPPEPAAKPEPTPEPVAEPAPPVPADPAPVQPRPEPAPPELPPPEIQPPPLPEPPPSEPLPPEPVIEDAVPLPEPPKPVPPPRPQAVKPLPKPRPVVQKAVPIPTEAAPAEVATAAPVVATVRREATAAATTSWQGRLQAHLARFKQYPDDARMRREEGTPVVRFTMTRAGKVLSYRLENSSGHNLLDREALALIERAQPLPPLPDEVPNATIELVLPLRFQLR